MATGHLDVTLQTKRITWVMSKVINHLKFLILVTEVFNIFFQNKGPGEECGSTCSSSEGCTHFVHASQHNGGTCYMKKGSVTKEDAVDNGDRSFVCGIVKGNTFIAYSNRYVQISI